DLARERWPVVATRWARNKGRGGISAAMNITGTTVFVPVQRGNLGVGNDPVYVKTRCFETFPFPEATEEQQDRIRTIAESLDAHRARQLDQHEKLTMTGMYNVLQKLRSGEPLTAAEKKIHEQGLVAVLRDLHDDLDAAVAEAYGWPVDLTD